MKQTVIGIFNREDEARNAVRELESLGFDRSDVDISSSRASAGMRQEGSEAVRSTSNATVGDHDDDSFGERVSRFFRGMFDDEDESNTYSNAARNRTIVTVQATSPDEATAACRVLDDAGAIDVNEGTVSGMDHDTSRVGSVTGDTSPIYREDTSPDVNIDDSRSFDDSSSFDDSRSFDDSNSTLNRDVNINQDSTNSIPVIEEQFQVGKREVQTGGVRVRSRIIEKPVEETLRLREETINVTRTPTDRPATESDLANFQDSEIELTETAEVPVINKEARVVEEVRLEKEVEDREETIRDTVRRTDVEVDQTAKTKKPRKRT